MVQQRLVPPSSCLASMGSAGVGVAAARRERESVEKAASLEKNIVDECKS